MEYKHASGGFPGSFWDTYTAFANTEGGTIIFGVEEKNEGLYLDVLSDETVEKYKKEFWSVCILKVLNILTKNIKT